MEPQTPPTSPSLSRFNLPLCAWITWGVYVVVRLGLLFARNSPLGDYEISGLLGELVASLLIPGALALLAWRLAGRSAKAGTVTFFVVFALMLLAQFVQFSRKVQANANLHRIADEQRTARQEGQPIPEEKNVEQAQRMSSQLGVIAETASGDEQRLAAGGKAFMDQLLAAKAAYDSAANALRADVSWDLTKVGDSKAIAARRETARAFAQANAQLASLQDETATAFRHELETRNVSAQAVQRAVDGYQKSAGPRLPLMVKMRETDAQIAQAILDFLDFAETNQGKWRTDPTSGKIVFDDKAAGARFNEILKRAKTAGTEQTGYQKQLGAPKE